MTTINIGPAATNKPSSHWISKHRLSKYADIFEQLGVEELSDLKLLDEADLMAVGVKRNRAEKMIDRFRHFTSKVPAEDTQQVSTRVCVINPRPQTVRAGINP